MRLAKRKVAAENRQAACAEGARQRHEKCRLAVSSGTVRENQAIAARTFRGVQKAANRSLPR